MRLCVMVEGQEGVTWDDWLALAQACERLGFEAMFRSDHYAAGRPGDERGALDAWTTLAALAARTTTLRLGTLVSPATFRHPSVLAKSAVTVDHISGGRVEVGMGAGWMTDEHERFGFAFPPTRTRMDMLAEQVEIVHRSWAGERFSFDGEHYRLADCEPLPPPVQRPHPPLILGGSGGRRSVALAARWADEYNTIFATAARCRELRARVTAACERAGRDPIPFSLMTGFLVGADRAELRERAARLAEWRGRDEDPSALLRALPGRGWVVGTGDEVVAQLGELAEAGVERVMLQHLLHRDLDALELLAREVAPQVR